MRIIHLVVSIVPLCYVLTAQGVAFLSSSSGLTRANWAQARIRASQEAYAAWKAEFELGHVSAFPVFIWSERWARAEAFVEHGAGASLLSAEAHLARMEQIDGTLKTRVALGGREIESYLGGDFYVLDAHIMVHDMRHDVESKRIKGFLMKRAAAARLIYVFWLNKLKQRQRLSGFSDAEFWSRAVLNSFTPLATRPGAQVAIRTDYLQRAKEFENLAKSYLEQDQIGIWTVYQAHFHRAEAEILLGAASTSKDQTGSDTERAKAMRLDFARQAFQAGWRAFDKRERLLDLDIEQLYDYSLEWRTAAVAMASNQSDKVKATEAHVSRMSRLKQIEENLYASGKVSFRTYIAAQYYNADAEVLLKEANVQITPTQTHK
jgi:hypothetical protein